MKLLHLAPKATKLSEILVAVAAARGCKTAEETAAFLDPLPSISNPFAALLPAYRAARDRVAQAIARSERVLIIGDYDADGVTSVSQMVLCLRAAGIVPRWFVPNRVKEGYGLTQAAVERAVRLHEPHLAIIVDCGSNSAREIEWLRTRNIDAIVIDHHPFTLTSNGALAHLNPRATPGAEALHPLSAAGLVHLFCDQLAVDLALTAWFKLRPAARILAGIGTVADLMPLTDINRALVKHALHHARNPEELAILPGLAALAKVSDTRDVTTTTFSFGWAPRINACGRIGDAGPAVALLLATTADEAEHCARLVEEANRERRELQDAITPEAIALGEAYIADHPDTRVLVLAKENWNPGVIGIVAAKIKEHFGRPAIVLGWQASAGAGTKGCWKGSGRSPDGFDIGAAVHAAVNRGCATTGGGHAKAAGITLPADKLDALRACLNEQCAAGVGAFEPVYEIIGHADALPAPTWHRVLERLEPFGEGNPKPHLAARGLQLAQEPMPRHARGDATPFLLSGLFASPRHAPQTSGQMLKIDWYEPARARDTWFPGRSYDFVVSLTRRLPAAHSPHSEPFYNLSVAACEPAAA